MLIVRGDDISNDVTTLGAYYYVLFNVCVHSRLSQSRSLGFLVWCGRTRHELSLARAPRSYDRASRSQSRYALKSSTCEQVYAPGTFLASVSDPKQYHNQAP